MSFKFLLITVASLKHTFCRYRDRLMAENEMPKLMRYREIPTCQAVIWIDKYKMLPISNKHCHAGPFFFEFFLELPSEMDLIIFNPRVAQRDS